MLAFHCDWEECEFWGSAEVTRDWVVVFVAGDDPRHYCCTWHMILDLSRTAEDNVVVEN